MPAKKDSCNTGYCVSCKEKRGMKNCKQSMTANKRYVLKGECVKCGTKMNKFIAAPK